MHWLLLVFKGDKIWLLRPIRSQHASMIDISDMFVVNITSRLGG